MSDTLLEAQQPQSAQEALKQSATAPSSLSLNKRITWFDDALLLGIMALLAGCGLIYEYLLSHYAGRILGA